MRAWITAAILLGAALAPIAGASGLPELLKQQLQAARRLRVFDRPDGSFGFQLSGDARPSTQVESLTLLRTEVVSPRPAQGQGQRKAWIWTVGQGNGWYGGEAGGGDRPEVRLLVEAGEASGWLVDFQLPAEKVAGGEIATLELGPYRPVYVMAENGLELAGVDGGPKANGGYEGLLGASGRLGVMRVAKGEDPAVPRKLLEARLDPPADLRVDTHYRVTLESAVARCLVRDLAPHPGPRLNLAVHGEVEVLAVRQLPGLRPVLYRREGENLVLHPGPGPGPRAFLVELAGVGPGAYAEEFELPSVGATAERRQVAGWLAIDREHPGADGSLGTSVGTPVEAKDLDPLVVEAFGAEGYRLYEAHDLRPSLSLSRPRNSEERRIPEAQVRTTLVRTPDAAVAPGTPVRYGWSEVTDVTFRLPPNSAWVEVSLFLPPGARAPQLYRDGKAQPVVLQTPTDGADPARRQLAPRLLLEAGREILLRYRRDRVPEVQGVLALALPKLDRELGGLTWNLDAPDEYLLGPPQVKRLEPAPAPSTPTIPAQPTASAGPSTGFGGGFSVPDVTEPTPPPGGRATGSHAVLERAGIDQGKRLEIELAVSRRDDLMVGHVVLFLAGLLLGSWLAWGRRVHDATVALPVVGALLVMVGYHLARAGAIHTPWGRAVLAGAVFGAFLRALWWAASENATARAAARKQGPAGGGKPGGADKPPSKAGEKPAEPKAAEAKPAEAKAAEPKPAETKLEAVAAPATSDEDKGSGDA